jgi:hypothetical protein
MLRIYHLPVGLVVELRAGLEGLEAFGQPEGVVQHSRQGDIRMIQNVSKDVWRHIPLQNIRIHIP